VDWLESELYEQGNLAKTMFDSYKRLISIRTNEKAFDPFGSFHFFDSDPRLFVIEQISSDNTEWIFAVHNFSNEAVTFSIPAEASLPLNDLLSSYVSDETRSILLEPYQMMWLKGSS
jgi:glucosylglycerate phosphorylase